MKNTTPKAFFAYPSNRPILMEAIRDAVDELNAGKEVSIKTWEKCNIGGKFIGISRFGLGIFHFFRFHRSYFR